MGFKLCQTYYDGDLYKTDAPPEAVYDIFKKFKQESQPEKYLENVPKTGPARTALEKPRKFEANWEFKIPKASEVSAANGDTQLVGKKRQGKYFVPTERNWGPKPRGTGGKKAKTEADDAAK